MTLIDLKSYLYTTPIFLKKNYALAFRWRFNDEVVMASFLEMQNLLYNYTDVGIDNYC